jgi:hypothetical protein
MSVADGSSTCKAKPEVGFYIIIASHRVKQTLDAAAPWLRANNLAYDEIHLSYDKTVLFDA